MEKSKIYTRSGDKGETSLVSGARVSKGDVQIELYGEVDQLNSEIGHFVALLNESALNEPRLLDLIKHVQNTLFDLGSLLACEPDNWSKYNLQLINTETIAHVEKIIDELDSVTPKIKNFILPGGSLAGSYAHVVRTTCRRVERLHIRYHADGNIVPDNSIELLNRLSDFFFVAARFVNNQLNCKEEIWSQN